MNRKRQVHLDFHTSEHINVGERFSKEQFKKALKAGHVNSVTLFSKCHHGWSYHPTNENIIHPKLEFDLLSAQLDACREIGVNAPIYLSAGYDEKEWVRSPKWRYVPSLDEDKNKEYYDSVRFHQLCFNTEYLDKLCSQIEEVMVLYNPCGIFLDIILPKICYCEKCKADMKSLGLDLNNEEDCEKFAYMVLYKYFEKTNNAVRKHSKTATIFHNGGHIPKGNYNVIDANTHLEVESLPTGGWGYDHFPLSAAYVRSLNDKKFLGMTGKFHSHWGEFGGFKHPNALIYETALSVANGAGCSIGDQLHPLCEMNMSTYNLIGKAYSLIEEKEPWLNGAENIADIAVLSAEAYTNGKDTKADIGANRMLLENNCLYNFIDSSSDFSQYKLLVIPDIEISDVGLIEKIKDYAKKGGKIIASGRALTLNDEFFLDVGAEYCGVSDFSPTYLIPTFETVNGITEYVMRCNAFDIKSIDCETVAYMQYPYFNRTKEHFCSHMFAPNNPNKISSGAVLKGNIAYIGWDIFSFYAIHGHLCFKELFTHILNRLMCNDFTVSAKIQDRAVVTYTRQETENRNILHLLFAYTTVRGEGTEIIEDTVPLYKVACEVKTNKKPSKVKLVPEEKEIDFEYSDGKVKFTVPKVDIHQMVSIEE